MAGAQGPRVRVLYDDDCGFCRWSLAVLLRWDRHGRLHPVCLQDPAAAQLLPDRSAAARMDSLHVVDDRGRVWSAGAAVTRLARELPAASPLAAAGAATPKAAERGYRAVAGRRAALGRLITARARRRADRVIAARTAS